MDLSDWVYDANEDKFWHVCPEENDKRHPDIFCGHVEVEPEKPAVCLRCTAQLPEHLIIFIRVKWEHGFGD